MSLNQEYFDNSGEAALSWPVRKSDYPFAKHIPPHGSRRELTTFYHKQYKKNSGNKQVSGDQIIRRTDEIYTIVEEQSEFPGGMAAFYKFLSSTMNYPAEARKKGIEGRVFVQFVVDEQGNTTEVRYVKGIGYGCNEAAVKAVKATNTWTPGMQRDKAVKVRMVLPIIFKLSDKTSIYQYLCRSSDDILRDF